MIRLLFILYKMAGLAKPFFLSPLGLPPITTCTHIRLRSRFPLPCAGERRGERESGAVLKTRLQPRRIVSNWKSTRPRPSSRLSYRSGADYETGGERALRGYRNGSAPRAANLHVLCRPSSRARP